MGAVSEPKLGTVAVGAKDLQSFFGPIPIPQTTVKGRPFYAISQFTTFNMINGQKVPVGLLTTNTLPAVGGHHFLSKLGIKLLLREYRGFSTLFAFLSICTGRTRTALVAKTLRYLALTPQGRSTLRVFLATSAQLFPLIFWFSAPRAAISRKQPRPPSSILCLFNSATLFTEGCFRITQAAAANAEAITGAVFFGGGLSFVSHKRIIPRYVWPRQGSF